MKLTGKCKEAFEKWYLKTQNKPKYLDTSQIRYSILAWFYAQPFNMQYGVYVDFFDSVGIRVFVEQLRDNTFSVQYSYCSEVRFLRGIPNKFLDRSEARQKAIEKANELYNEKYK